MEGRWGRRIFGRIWKEGSFTWFRLVMETQEKNIISSTAKISTMEIEQYPSTYKFVLDRLVYELQKQLNRTNNTP